jgi:hypothetical protein
MREASPADIDWRRRSEFAERGFGGVGPGLLFAGLAVAALGAMAWYYLGPDLRRYLKIKSM